MPNLTKVYTQLTAREMEIMVAIWNTFNEPKVSIAVLPFVDAKAMHELLMEFYAGANDDQTMMFPNGVTFQELFKAGKRMKAVVKSAL